MYKDLAWIFRHEDLAWVCRYEDLAWSTSVEIVNTRNRENLPPQLDKPSPDVLLRISQQRGFFPLGWETKVLDIGGRRRIDAMTSGKLPIGLLSRPRSGPLPCSNACIRWLFIVDHGGEKVANVKLSITISAPTSAAPTFSTHSIHFLHYTPPTLSITPNCSHILILAESSRSWFIDIKPVNICCSCLWHLWIKNSASWCRSCL